ncbi:piggyBac transposable element-derived protein 3-like [Penaeus indicus]|uniref:piggyBac transposable element-derived protein 3-like n=1 Tax=Penaeus indicus TaxID=29960 RepID=UPI00300D3087
MNFMCINIVMGYHKLPGLHHYWATAEDLGVRPIREAMVRDRFMSTLSKLHLNDNSKMNPNNKDKLYKLRPLIDSLNRIFLDIRSPGEQLSVDESMIRFKGRCSFKQYNPMKPIKRDYKMWCLAGNAGYIFKFDIYTGKGGDTEPNLRKEYGLGEVLKLTDHLRGKNHKVFFDNIFTSFALLKVLQSFRIQACGTIRPTRKDFPCLAGDKELKRGDFDYRSTPNGIIAYKWKDNKTVHLASNYHGISPTTVKRTEKYGNKITIPCPQKLIHLFQLRTELARGLLTYTKDRKARGTPKRRKTEYSIPTSVRFTNTGVHWPKFTQKKGRSPEGDKYMCVKIADATRECFHEPRSPSSFSGRDVPPSSD